MFMYGRPPLGTEAGKRIFLFFSMGLVGHFLALFIRTREGPCVGVPGTSVCAVLGCQESLSDSSLHLMALSTVARVSPCP